MITKDPNVTAFAYRRTSPAAPIATLAEWTELGKAFSLTAIYTYIRTAYVRTLSGPFIDLLLKHVDKMPAGARAMLIISHPLWSSNKRCNDFMFRNERTPCLSGDLGPDLR
jgi:hypothetical protein